MKTKIYYFSGTGNSLAVAKELAGGIADAELIPITYSFDHSQKIDDVKVGLVFPVYCWGPPLIVVDFIKKLNVDPGTYIFTAATYGGMLAYSLKILQKLLKERNLELSAGFSINMPGNYVPLYNVWSEEKQKQIFDKAKTKIKKIVDTVNAQERYKTETNLGPFGMFLSNAFYSGMMGKMKEADKSFWVDEKCNKCEICIKICPAGNIKMNDGKLEWQHKCEQCLRCLHWCPEKAIQFGKKTQSRGRYHHPDTKVQDFIS
ncbi:MAG: EFR1 family ferrodoxin [Endomicrobiales bacterium]|nr:EFR1 family ferrodoxin [Endomicrobiales bacterium]